MVSCCEDFNKSLSTVKGGESVPVKFIKDSCCMIFVFLILALGLVS